MSVIVCDTREKKTAHITDYFDEKGLKWVRSKLYVGDYSLLDNMSVCVDRKKDLQEVYGNLIGKKPHIRFREEADRARESGIRLVILVEDGTIDRLEDVHRWNNRRIWQYRMMLKRGETPKFKEPIPSATLQKIMERFAEVHGVEWRFCKKNETAKTILELLNYEEGDYGRD